LSVEISTGINQGLYGDWMETRLQRFIWKASYRKRKQLKIRISLGNTFEILNSCTYASVEWFVYRLISKFTTIITYQSNYTQTETSLFFAKQILKLKIKFHKAYDSNINELYYCNNYFLTNWKPTTNMSFSMHRSPFNPILSENSNPGNQ